MRIFLLCCTLLTLHGSLSWGFFAHKKINYYACFKLPAALFRFYKPHIFEIEELAIKADQRRYIKKDEGMGHYIDLDFYEACLPLDTVPRFWKPALDSFSQDTVEAHGILPWRIMLVFRNLEKAFASFDSDEIIRLSADLGHYIADAHVPLHTTENYNGQLTDQHGIHGLWESRLPELFWQDYELLTGEAAYLTDPLGSVWKIIEESFAAKDSVLLLEKMQSRQFESGKYSFENRGTTVVKVYSREFCEAYHIAMQNMVERRMTQAIRAVACFWYTAWVNAGQPHLVPVSQNEFGPLMRADSQYVDSVISNPPKRTLIH